MSYLDDPIVDPARLALQAQFVLRELDEDHPARQALGAFIERSNAQLYEALALAQRAADSPTWAEIEPMEQASLNLYFALALHEVIAESADDPSLDAVGTLLRSAKHYVDEKTRAMAARVRTPAKTSLAATHGESNSTLNAAPMKSARRAASKAETATA